MKPVKKITEIQKMPPNDIEIEEAVLGCLILESESIYIINSILKPEHFYKEANEQIYKAILSLLNEKSPIDILTICKRLQKMDVLDIVGGSYYVSSLTNRIASAVNIEYYARILVQKYIAREIIVLTSNITVRAHREDEDIFELIDEVKNKLNIIEKDLAEDKDFKTIAAIGDEFLEDIEKKRQGLHPDGVESGLKDIKFTNSDSIIVAARPGMGKTAFVLRCLRECIKNNNPAAIFSIEMSAKQLLTRIASAECEIDSERLKNGELNNSEVNDLYKRINELKKSKLYIDDTAGIDIERLCSKARKLKRDCNIELLVIDYIGLINTKEYAGQKVNQVGYISRKIKQLAKELNIPIISLSQLSRKVDERPIEKRMPELSDLRDSGDIEQDADEVYFLFRPQYYGADTLLIDGQELDVRGKALIKKSKNRHGAIFTNMYKFIGKYTDFRNEIETPDQLQPIQNNTNFLNDF
jgi:replicative DNA helicase